MRRLYSHRAYQRRTTHRRPVRTEPRRGRSLILAVVGFAACVGFGLLYVSQVNSVATSGIAMKDLEQQIRELERANQDLELQAASLRSLSTVEQTSKELDLVARAPIEYLPAVSDTVARSE